MKIGVVVFTQKQHFHSNAFNANKTYKLLIIFYSNVRSTLAIASTALTGRGAECTPRAFPRIFHRFDVQPSRLRACHRILPSETRRVVRRSQEFRTAKTRSVIKQRTLRNDFRLRSSVIKHVHVYIANRCHSERRTKGERNFPLLAFWWMAGRQSFHNSGTRFLGRHRRPGQKHHVTFRPC